MATADALVGAVSVSGSGTLAIFDFTAIGAGTTDLACATLYIHSRCRTQFICDTSLNARTALQL